VGGQSLLPGEQDSLTNDECFLIEVEFVELVMDLAFEVLVPISYWHQVYHTYAGRKATYQLIFSEIASMRSSSLTSWKSPELLSGQ
jgi:hypothetical protein